METATQYAKMNDYKIMRFSFNKNTLQEVNDLSNLRKQSLRSALKNGCSENCQVRFAFKILEKYL